MVNPNRYHTNVNPGVDTESEELKGPWSDPTDPVTVPADVAAYAMRKANVAGRRDDQVTFQIVRWNPDNGFTPLTRTDDAGPGELIGQYQMAQIPSTEGKGTKAESVDFNSHRVVLDSMGGFMPAPKTIGATAPFEEPALTMVLRPDAVAARPAHAAPRRHRPGPPADGQGLSPGPAGVGQEADASPRHAGHDGRLVQHEPLTADASIPLDGPRRPPAGPRASRGPGEGPGPPARGVVPFRLRPSPFRSRPPRPAKTPASRRPPATLRASVTTRVIREFAKSRRIRTDGIIPLASLDRYSVVG